MAYDGLVVSATIKEFRETLTGGKISKIIQPEKDEIHFLVRNQKDNIRLRISVNPSLPLCCLTSDQRPAPITAPVFCMTLRKHIGNGTILSIRQPDQTLRMDGLERVIIFEIEHLDEMGDLCRRYLSVELMGKYSNIILLREDMSIIDSIKRISISQSSVREVLPNREYFIPDASEKTSPLAITESGFTELMHSVPEPTFSALFHRFTGLSPLSATEICHRAGVDADLSANCQEPATLARLYTSFHDVISSVSIEAKPEPNIIYKDEMPQDFSAIRLSCYEGDKSYRVENFDSMSAVIQTFYEEKEHLSRNKQRTTDLRKVITTLLERTAKKLALQEKQMKDTEGKDKYRVYGELLNTYGYSLTGGEDHLICDNYYTGKEIRIPLLPELTSSQNAKRYFDKYDKQKRTEENLTTQLTETRNELTHLESIKTSLDIAESEEDLKDIRREMMDYSFIKKSTGKDKSKGGRKSEPYHYKSTDGYDIYVGKNNYQNEEVSFHIADGGDMWFHAKGVAGSHVIVKTHGETEKTLPDRVFIEAAQLAAYYSSHKNDQKVDVDYTMRKNLKKVPNAAPGFVIYNTNWSVTVEPKLIQNY